MIRIPALILAATAVALSAPATAQQSPIPATLYKNPQCECCEAYADYLGQNGYDVTVKPIHDLSLIKQQFGVEEPLEGCHTTLVEGYVVEGHVPVSVLNRLLDERPQIRGISLPGMPTGSPGMSGEKVEPFTIYEISDDPTRVYDVE